MKDVSDWSQQQWIETERDLEDERREQRRMWLGFGIGIACLIFLLVVTSVLMP